MTLSEWRRSELALFAAKAEMASYIRREMVIEIESYTNYEKCIKVEYVAGPDDGTSMSTLSARLQKAGAN